MQSWYLLYCKQRNTGRARQHLERQGITCFAPLLYFQKYTRSKFNTHSEPMFPNYLFITFKFDQIHTTSIRFTRGVSHFVSFGTKPATVPEDIINQLKQYTPPCRNPPHRAEKNKILHRILNEPNSANRSLLLLSLISNLQKPSSSSPDVLHIT